MKLLIVEDELPILRSITKYFEDGKFICEQAQDYQTASEKIHLYEHDCIILDLNLPDGSGFDLLDELKTKKSNAGVIILSARNSLDDRLKGLNLGSDDYVNKPFHLSELNARVNAVIRRKNFHVSNVIELNGIVIDLTSKMVSIKGENVIFHRKEFDLLLYFIQNANRVVSKSSLSEHIWGDDMDVVDNYDFLYAQIKILRKKLKLYLGEECIKTVYGIGYIFEKH